MENETRLFWDAANTARAGLDLPAVQAAVDELTGIALHGASHIAQRALDTLRGLAAGPTGAVARYAGEAVAWCDEHRSFA